MTFKVGDWVVTGEEVEVPDREWPGEIGQGPGYIGRIEEANIEGLPWFEIDSSPWTWHRDWLKPLSFIGLMDISGTRLRQALVNLDLKEELETQLKISATLREALISKTNQLLV